jgi:hypothetical protein
MLNRSTPKNHYQEYALLARTWRAEMLAEAEINPSTLRSRRRRARLRENKRDPVNYTNVPLRRSVTLKTMELYERTLIPEQRCFSIDEKSWRTQFALAIQCILTTWTLTPPKK